MAKPPILKKGSLLNPKMSKERKETPSGSGSKSVKITKKKEYMNPFTGRNKIVQKDISMRKDGAFSFLTRKKVKKVKTKS